MIAAGLCDCHTHVGLDLGFYLRGWWPYAATAGELLEQLDRHDLDRAVCFPFCLSSAYDPAAFADGPEPVIRLKPSRFPYDRENPALLRECHRLDPGGDRLLPFAMFDPARAVGPQLAALEAMAHQLHGLKLQGTVLQSPARSMIDGDGAQLMALAARHDLPVLLHTAVLPADRWAQVRDCLDVAAEHPRVRFCLAHSLRFDGPLIEEAASRDNVWVDCSGHLSHCEAVIADLPIVAPPARRFAADYSDPAAVLIALDEALPGRLLWGSDTPYMSWCDDEIRMVRRYGDEAEVLFALPAPVRQQIASASTAAWLGARSLAEAPG